MRNVFRRKWVTLPLCSGCPSGWMCRVCSLILREAHLILSTGEKCCLKCLPASGKTEKNDVLSLAPLNEIILAAQVSCPNTMREVKSKPGGDSGVDTTDGSFCEVQTICCEWKGPLSQLETHQIQECQFHHVPCRYAKYGCAIGPLPALQMAEHLQNASQQHLDLMENLLSSSNEKEEPKKDHSSSPSPEKPLWSRSTDLTQGDLNIGMIPNFPKIPQFRLEEDLVFDAEHVFLTSNLIEELAATVKESKNNPSYAGFVVLHFSPSPQRNVFSLPPSCHDLVLRAWNRRALRQSWKENNLLRYLRYPVSF